MKKEFKISLGGCDDTTEIKLELTKREVELIKKICKMSEEISYYNCMPTMTIEQEVQEEDDLK